MARDEKISKKKIKQDCSFCKTKTVPDYKNPSSLRRFMSERGKILAAGHTGTCAKHQRVLREMIIRARFLALVPYVDRTL